MKKIRGILSDYGTLKNCRIMGLVGFWDRTAIDGQVSAVLGLTALSAVNF